MRLESDYLGRLPDQLSGGVRQRIAVQTNILKLQSETQAQRSMASLFISPDLAVERALTYQVGVLHLRVLCEGSNVEDVFNPPSHPHTRLQLSASRDSGQRPEPPHGGGPFAPHCPSKAELNWKSDGVGS